MNGSSSFISPWWLKNRHAQTVFPRTPLCRVPALAYRRERLELRDGDFVDLDWLPGDDRPEKPLLILLHGLEGSSDSTYARLIMDAAAEAGLGGVVLNFRGCSGEANRLPRRYHAGDTDDLRYLLSVLRRRWPDRVLTAAGISLGGNVLLKYLGEEGAQAPLSAAISICPPFDLAESARALARPGGGLYQRFLLSGMKKAMRVKYQSMPIPFDWDRAMQSRNFFDFDDIVTAPLHGFKDVDEYYRESSSGQFLGSITKPTLLISALDDPFMTAASFPDPNELPANVRAAFSANGGHVGFISGSHPLAPRYFLPDAVLGFIRTTLGEVTTLEEQVQPA